MTTKEVIELIIYHENNVKDYIQSASVSQADSIKDIASIASTVPIGTTLKDATAALKDQVKSSTQTLQ